MKKLIIILTLLFSTAIYSQVTLIVKLVQSNGYTPLTGESANITFRYYPYTASEEQAGLTITESGSTGTYKIKGFSTYRYYKMFLSGTEYSAFDSVLAGDIFNWLPGYYILKAGAVTGITGNKTISSGDWLKLGGTETWYKPYIYSGSSWITDYSQPSSYSLIWKAYADSVYGIKHWFLDGNDIRLESGYEIHGRTSGTSPIPLNTDQFFWYGDILNLNPTIFNADSIKHDNLTIGKDSTWQVLGEDVSKWKFLSLKKGFYATAGNVPDWKWYYKSFNEGGTLVASDSFAVINDKVDIEDNNYYARTVDSISVTAIDTFYFPTAGYWDVTVHFEFEFEYVTPNNTGYDSLFVALYHGYPSENDILDYATYKRSFNSGVPTGYRDRSDLTFTYKIYAGILNDPFTLAALTSGICHTASGSQKIWIRRNKVEAVKVR